MNDPPRDGSGQNLTRAEYPVERLKPILENFCFNQAD